MKAFILLDHKPLVDVIVPIYGVELYIDKCLYSLACQDYRNFRAILVDDGSTDGSAAIAQCYAERDTRFVYLRKENGGTGSARNHGIECTEGDLMMFVDPDDWVEPDYVSSMVAAIGHGHDIALCNFVGSAADGRPIWFGNAGRHDHPDPYEDVITSLTDVFPWNKIYRRAQISKHDRFESTMYEDFGLVPSFVGRARSIGFAHGVKYHYVQRRNSATGDERRLADGRVNLAIFDAYTHLKRRRDLFLDDRWEKYEDLALPHHLFINRVTSVHSFPLSEVRSQVIRNLARSLNVAHPAWAGTSAVRNWIEAEPNLVYRAMKEVVVGSYRSERMALLFALQALRQRVRPRPLLP